MNENQENWQECVQDVRTGKLEEGKKILQGKKKTLKKIKGKKVYSELE